MSQATAAINDVKPQNFRLLAPAKLPPWVDVIAFSSTRWKDSYSRPRELMMRCARDRRVFFFEEPVFDAPDDDYFEFLFRDGVNVLIPHLRISTSTTEATMAKLLGLLLSLAEIHDFIFWYFCPFPIRYTSQFTPRCSIYDCVNEPFWLRDAVSPLFDECERRLRFSANLVFTSDLKLYLATSAFRSNVYLFVDADLPKASDWDQLWHRMNRLVSRTLGAEPVNSPAAN